MEPFSENRMASAEAENSRILKELIVEKSGYVLVSTVEDLGLTEEETKKVQYASPDKKGVIFFKSQTEDGKDVKVLVRPLAGRYVAADVFSDAFPGGHGFNNDFLWDELRLLLEQAKGRSRQSS